MSDWQKGDLAWCFTTKPVVASIFNDSLSRLRSGGLYTVNSVSRARNHIILGLDEVKSTHPTGRWNATRFIKVTPDAETLEDRGIIALMNKEPNHVDR